MVMPTFSLTPPQRRALEALDWLYDSTQRNRRTGRSTVLALHYLRRLILSEDTNRWLNVEDHVSIPGNERDRSVVLAIEYMAAQLGFNGVEVHPNGLRIRLRAGTRIPREVIEAISEFGDLPEETMQPPSNQRYDRPEPDPLATPPKTLWDHLKDDDPSSKLNVD
jgi:hypothetical protein